MEENTIQKIKEQSLLANIYRYGPPPTDLKKIRKEKHPKNARKTVRFINQNGTLYFNMGDWLKPYKNKLYEKMVKSTVKPPANKHLNELWMMVDAWQTIENAVKNRKESIEVVKTWESGRLF